MAGLHSIIGKQALQNITDADLKLLSEINDDFQCSIEKQNTKQALQLDIQFHNTISSIAKNQYIEPFLENMQLHVLRLEYLFSKTLFQQVNLLKNITLSFKHYRSRMKNKWNK